MVLWRGWRSSLRWTIFGLRRPFCRMLRMSLTRCTVVQRSNLGGRKLCDMWLAFQRTTLLLLERLLQLGHVKVICIGTLAAMICNLVRRLRDSGSSKYSVSMCLAWFWRDMQVGNQTEGTIMWYKKVACAKLERELDSPFLRLG